MAPSSASSQHALHVSQQTTVEDLPLSGSQKVSESPDVPSGALSCCFFPTSSRVRFVFCRAKPVWQTSHSSQRRKIPLVLKRPVPHIGQNLIGLQFLIVLSAPDLQIGHHRSSVLRRASLPDRQTGHTPGFRGFGVSSKPWHDGHSFLSNFNF
jgi:hypothetical protein